MSKFIVIEGTDCSGKETQSKLLVDSLNKLGKKTVYLTFPNYNSPTGKIVGGPYLGKEEICKSYFPEGASHVDAKVASLYFAADRYYNLNVIKEYLDKDYIVIMDRYVSSNMAHQGGKIKDKDKRYEMYDWLEKLEYEMMGLIRPDMTLFLHMPTSYARILKKNRTSLDDHEKDDEHLLLAEHSYLELSNKYNFINIDCVLNNEIRSINDIHDEILKKITNH